MPKCSYNFKSGSMLTMTCDMKTRGESSHTKTPQATSVKVELKLFTGKENFILWQMRMKYVLKQHGLSVVLARKEKKPETMTEAE
ncbi:hypothetical protein L3X38_038364 [Prunus dulcis]|uniref:Uncharacterized protein n=1 Tax=Prunus dulcis TaxID=3755 RepID=A0AAD4V6D3_PRUDU|nr:hypothetical protein L3X38_038364 [Prunus dulcis]